MNRQEWLTLRRSAIGASEAAALFDLHPYHSRYSLWAEKTGQAEPDDQSDQQEFGLAIEPYLAARYARETGRRVIAPKPYTRYVIGHAAATPDRFFADAAPKTPEGPLELKSGIHFDPSEDLLPYWQIQVQQQIYCTELERGSFAILGAFNRFFYRDVEANARFIALLVEKIEEFWDLVTRGVPPAVDGHTATTEALRRLHPKDNGRVISLPAEASAWTENLTGVQQQIKTLEAQETALKNSLLEALGDATAGVLDDGTGWTLKTTERKAFTVEATEFRQLRRTTKQLKRTA